jgi:hypothetical protein
MANVRKRAAGGVAGPRVNDTSVVGTAASGTVDRNGAKDGGETTQSRKPWPAEFGWDFPFDFPKPGR